MARTNCILLLCIVSYLTVNVVCKIVLPHNLRYLENMLNADVVAKAAKIRQRMEANPNNQDSDKGWPMLLAKYQADDKNNKSFYPSKMYGGIYNTRYQNY